MVKDNIQYVKLEEVLSRLLRHPLLQELSIEAAIQYTIDFIHIFGLPEMFQNKEATLQIVNYRAKLPCDVISINQVKDACSNICIRSMTDTFEPSDNNYYPDKTYKVQNTMLITSFKEGTVLINYKAIPIDEDGYPLLIDNSNFLKALELYIKKEAFQILFDTNKITPAVFQTVAQEYAWAAGRLQSEFNIPNESEMESIARSWTTLVQRVTDFDDGFKSLGNREYLKRH